MSTLLSSYNCFWQKRVPSLHFYQKVIFDIFDFFPYFGLYLPFCDRQHGTFLYGRTHIIKSIKCKKWWKKWKMLKMTFWWKCIVAVSYTHLRAHETVLDLVCRLLLEKKSIICVHPYKKVPCCRSQKGRYRPK